MKESVCVFLIELGDWGSLCSWSVHQDLFFTHTLMSLGSLLFVDWSGDETRRELLFFVIQGERKEKKEGCLEFHLGSSDSSNRTHDRTSRKEREGTISHYFLLSISFELFAQVSAKGSLRATRGRKYGESPAEPNRKKRRRFIRLVSEGSQGTVEEWTRSKGIPSPFPSFFPTKASMNASDRWIFFFLLLRLSFSQYPSLVVAPLDRLRGISIHHIRRSPRRPFFFVLPFLLGLFLFCLPFGDSWRIIHDHSRIHWRGWPTRIVFPYGGSKWRRVYPICSTWARVLIRSIFTHLKGCLPLHCVYQVTFFL